MRQVWKYKLNMVELTAILLPVGSKVVHVGEQLGLPHIWVEQSVEDNVDKETRYFYFVGTGHALPTGHAHIDHRGTYFQGPFVWHVYEGW